MSQAKSQPDTWSSTDHQFVKFTHRWVVNGLNFYLKTSKPGDRPEIESPKFSPPNDPTIKFYFLLYPKGETEVEKGYVSLYLMLFSCPNSEMRVKTKLSIIDQHGGKQDTTKKFVKGRGWGCYNFIKHEKLNALLTNGKLTIFCEIKAMVDLINTIGSSSQDTQIESQVLGNLCDLFNSRKLSDFVLVTGDLIKTEHRAHRAILAARSPVFCAMFEHDTKERNNGRVRIKDIEGDVIKEMLRFIYTGKVQNLDELADRLLEAADKYDLDLLKSLCEQSIIANLNADTVVSMLVLADKHSTEKLRVKAIEFINENLSEITQTDNWKAIEEQPKLWFELFSKLLVNNLKRKHED